VGRDPTTATNRGSQLPVHAGRLPAVDHQTTGAPKVIPRERGSALCVSFEVTRPSNHRDERKLAAKRTARFTGLTFLITLGTGLLVVLSDRAQLVNGARPVPHSLSLPMPIAVALIVLGGWGPGLAAICVTAWESGRPGVRELLRQFRRWRIGPIWYAAALLGPALLGLIALVLSAVTGGPTPAHWFSAPRARLLGLTVGPWGEELGWRGFAQPQLQRGIGAFWASLVVGTIWSVWHYWPVLTPAGGHLSEFVSAGFLTWWAYELANSVILAWLYNRTGGSLPIAWAGHAGLTLGQSLVNSHPIPFGWFIITFWAAAALVTLASRAQPNTSLR
jgi:membrane protease YdiL (CAAX protease family)